jgi:hypothetical protein
MDFDYNTGTLEEIGTGTMPAASDGMAAQPRGKPPLELSVS